MARAAKASNAQTNTVRRRSPGLVADAEFARSISVVIKKPRPGMIPDHPAGEHCLQYTYFLQFSIFSVSSGQVPSSGSLVRCLGRAGGRNWVGPRPDPG